ncbi:MAG: aldehyde ferredoxin oxidoreductase C-terminal domain-containing protein [Vicinamibacterales bacterium]|jgi:aldehyde:ferredoxin oxidoreductase|nr:aldehyde ferredoxin oxidoreductase C-terminal domain-containing protein [Vicinamibacterales bacterium]MDP7471734.1 aldehyde ferredoxin oxidoreductase C-terminal domain-containing protein [Vicinamibacterales bacterium]MDP7672362.1 aldehyde ferredoxin oxidoreductase C-terminal domain-containing protein [Vicinamibacterales bacterium]HJO37943.1 aldehyde ferredoxin oxidoreductase C-terminal domain-containing protein [Vicinamibacterales bacterium]|tara:strand:+ start:2239 stop:4191 length:1953 start_codon:yes stop_codon:yes gene_type:complete
MSIDDRVARLLAELPVEPQFPTQGATLFIDLARRQVRQAYTPRKVVETFLAGRGANMFYLHRLLDETLDPTDPSVPLIFGSGVLTGLVPSAARGNATSWSPESGVLMDSNAGDYFPSFMKMNGLDHLVVYGPAEAWTWLWLGEGRVEFRDATPYLGLDNIDLRDRMAVDLDGTWTRDLAMASITRAGENQVMSSAIMAGPKACYARGGTGAKMGSLKVKAIVVQGQTHDFETAQPYKPYNKTIAMKLLGTSVVKHALRTMGTPFLYKPSRILGAMGTKNNQETTWTDQLDAEHITPYRPGMDGCFRCPVNCRPLNHLNDDAADKYGRGDGPEYVTLGKFGPNVGIDRLESVIRLNNICNDLGLDTASSGSTIAWAMELYQRGIIGTAHTGGLELTWGDAELVERLLFDLSRREGFGNVLADGTRAVERGHYPAEALKYRMAVKGLMQSDPHDARILKAFALGLAVATRGMDHLRNRVTLEINARVNDDPDFKAKLYGAPVAAKPNVYETKERAVRACENVYGVGDAVGMCRFTTKLFNSPSLPGLEQFSDQIANVTGLALDATALDRIGLNIMGVERLINQRLGVRRSDDTLPERWFDEEIEVGAYKGERIDRGEFDSMLSRFYEISGLNDEGVPAAAWRRELESVLAPA